MHERVYALKYVQDLAVTELSGITPHPATTYRVPNHIWPGCGQEHFGTVKKVYEKFQALRMA